MASSKSTAIGLLPPMTLTSRCSGESFIGLYGGADFYAKDVDGLKTEGAASLAVFLDMCREDGVDPRREFSGKFNLRVSPRLHADISSAAAAEGKSINQWITEVLDRAVQAWLLVSIWHNCVRCMRQASAQRLWPICLYFCANLWLA